MKLKILLYDDKPLLWDKQHNRSRNVHRNMLVFHCQALGIIELAVIRQLLLTHRNLVILDNQSNLLPNDQLLWDILQSNRKALVKFEIFFVFQVFFSSYIFSANVMVKVATRPADNPVSILWNELGKKELHEMLWFSTLNDKNIKLVW